MNQATELLIIAGKSTVIYVFMIFAIRLFGKKELAQLSVMDLVFILLISNSVQNAMVGTNSTVIGGIAAALGLFITNFIFKILIRNSNSFSKLVQGEKIVLIIDGKVHKSGLREALMSLDELKQTVREHGVESIEKVNLAYLEVDGNISILSDNYKTRTHKLHKKPNLSRNL